LAQEDIP